MFLNLKPQYKYGAHDWTGTAEVWDHVHTMRARTKPLRSYFDYRIALYHTQTTYNSHTTKYLLIIHINQSINQSVF